MIDQARVLGNVRMCGDWVEFDLEINGWVGTTEVVVVLRTTWNWFQACWDSASEDEEIVEKTGILALKSTSP